MKTMRIDMGRFLAGIMGGLMLAGMAIADGRTQTSTAELDALFRDLADASSATSADAAVQEIWQIWLTDSENNISQVIGELQKDSTIRNGKTLLLGVSSGGSSALEIASKNPIAYYGVIAVPGRIKQSGPLPELEGLPVFLRIAEKDYFRWHKQMADITQRLESAGARLDVSLVPDAKHVIKVKLDELDRWLDTLEH